MRLIVELTRWVNSKSSIFYFCWFEVSYNVIDLASWACKLLNLESLGFCRLFNFSELCFRLEGRNEINS